MDRDPPRRLALGTLLHASISNLESRRPSPLDPLLDVGDPVTTGLVGEGIREVGKRGTAETVLAVEERQRCQKRLITHRTAGHVEEHQTFSVAYGLRRRRLAGAEFGEWKILARGHHIRVFLERGAAVGGALAPLLGKEVIGHVGGQPLTPVAVFESHIDRVPPPVVKQFVGVRGGENPRESNDSWAEEGETGHPVPCFPEVLDQGKRGVGVGRQHSLVKVEVAGGSVQVALREGGVVIAKEGKDLHVARFPRVLVPRSCNEIDLLGRMREAPRGRAKAFTVDNVSRSTALRYHVPRWLQTTYFHIKGHETVAKGRHPKGGAGKEDPTIVDDSRRLGEAPLVLLTLGCELVMNDASIDQFNGAEHIALGYQEERLERHIFRHRIGGGVDPQEPGLGGTVLRIHPPTGGRHSRFESRVENESISAVLIGSHRVRKTHPIHHLQAVLVRFDADLQIVVHGPSSRPGGRYAQEQGGGQGT
jgi:hypothetical protein